MARGPRRWIRWDGKVKLTTGYAFLRLRMLSFHAWYMGLLWECRVALPCIEHIASGWGRKTARRAIIRKDVSGTDIYVYGSLYDITAAACLHISTYFYSRPWKRFGVDFSLFRSPLALAARTYPKGTVELAHLSACQLCT